MKFEVGDKFIFQGGFKNDGSYRFNGQEVEIVSIFEFRGVTSVVIGHETLGHHSISHPALFLRPIKSERDIAIEEINNFLQSPKSKNTTLAEDLYDSGFRKVKND